MASTQARQAVTGNLWRWVPLSDARISPIVSRRTVHQSPGTSIPGPGAASFLAARHHGEAGASEAPQAVQGARRAPTRRSPPLMPVLSLILHRSIARRVPAARRRRGDAAVCERFARRPGDCTVVCLPLAAGGDACSSEAERRISNTVPPPPPYWNPRELAPGGFLLRWRAGRSSSRSTVQ